jgi:membrane-associated phospholipid phosphatase
MSLLRKLFLPHEIFFGGFLFLTWVRLVWQLGVFDMASLVFFLFLACKGLCLYACGNNTSSNWWRLRLLYYPIVMVLSFAYLGSIIPVLHPGYEDLFLQKIDHWLVGGNLSLLFQKCIHPVLTEIMCFSYLFFFPYLIGSMIRYFRKDLQITKKFFVGLFTVIGVGFLCYTLVPALGPYEAMADQFKISVSEGSLFTHLNHFLVPLASNHCDVFPSLHCSVSSYILFFDRLHAKSRFKRYLPLCVLIWISTIYLRYHYFIDIIAGFSLAYIALQIAHNFYKKAIRKEATVPTAVVAEVTNRI